MGKRIITVTVILMLVLSPLSGIAAEGQIEEKNESESISLNSSDSYAKGIFHAKNEHATGGWVAAGLIGGGLFSWLGTGITVLIAAGSNPSPDYIPESVKDTSYIMGYQKEAKKKNLRSVAIPGIIMSTVWTMVYLAALSSY